MDSVHYRLELPPYSPGLVSDVFQLAVSIFNEVDESDFRWRLANLPERSLALACVSSEILGFKFGHALSLRRYQSWLGGVRKDARRQGIARRLMDLQHDWVAARGFSSIETNATHENLAMLALNRQSGFQIIGEYNRDGIPRVIQYKQLRGG